MAKVGIYHPWIYLTGGIERVLVEMHKRSRHELTVFTNHYEPENTFPEMKEINIVELKYISVKRSLLPLVKAVLGICRQKIDLSDIDVLLVCSSDLGDLITFQNKERPIICMCFTPLKIVHDPYSRQRIMENPKHFVYMFKILEKLFKVVERRAWNNYDRIFSVSEEVRKRIVEANLAVAEKIFIDNPGVDLEFFLPTDVYESFFLVPGRIMWQKNIELAISAFKLLRKQNLRAKNFRLVIAGTVDVKSQPYYKILKNLVDGNDGIEFVESPSDQELRKLYQSCYSVLFTALNEDWGLVPVEAMASGKPVISVNRGGPLEVVTSEKTGYLVNPEPEEFAKTMNVLLDNPDLVRSMGKAARDHALSFTWDSFVQKLDDCVDELLETKRI
ncbi:MAG: glycosyltransferase family 4 protein [Actinobacteria bacterium]|nr:glycosyltransferase family 4 protein [Actinomycetota bacterium]